MGKEIINIETGDIVPSDWYERLTEDCRAIIVERMYRANQEKIECWHEIGERIVTDNNFQKAAKGNLGCLSGLIKNLGVSQATIYRAIAFYEKYPNLDDLPEGKNLTWNMIVTKYLPAPKLIKTPILPDGKYSVIYADPAWPIGSIVMDKWESPIDDKYPTMAIDEIGALPVIEHSADDCSLFLWTTHTFLPVAFEIIEKWGFKYFCCITWNKGSGWTQNGFHKMTEFLLFAYKGTMNVDQFGRAIPTLISETKTLHSKKPDSIRDLIKSKTPEPRLEMFAREEHEGWVSWGNEVNNG